MTYELKAPLFFVGQTVNFLHHNKNMLVGKIVRVETHYGKKSGTKNPHGYHIYAITTPTAKKRSVWIGEEYISGVVGRNEPCFCERELVTTEDGKCLKGCYYNDK